ncbi:MAG: YfhO family protein [bacterium]|nr:YfhO family protein [bacterium]
MTKQIPISLKELLLAAILCIISIVIIFYPAVFQGHLIYQIAEAGSDSLDLNITRRYLAAQSILKYGEIPLWEPRIGCGVPLLAESEAGIFHPTFLLFFLNNLTLANNLTIFSAILIAMLGSYYWCRCLQLDPLPSAVSAFAYGLGETFLLRTSALNIIHVLCWLPLSLALIYLAIQTSKKRYSLLLTIVWTLQLLASHFNMAAICLICCCIYTVILIVYNMLQHHTHPYKVTVIRLLLALFFAFSLSLIQILPTHEFTQHSIRRETKTYEAYNKVCNSSLTCNMLAIFINPFYRSCPSTLTNSMTNDKMGLYAHDTFQYIGLLPFILCFNTFAKKRRPIAISLWILVFFFFITSLGPRYGIYYLLFNYCPYFSSFNNPGRFAVPMMCTMAILAAIGAQNLYDLIKLRFNNRLSKVLLSAIIIITLFDLGYVNSQIQGYLPANWSRRPEFLNGINNYQRIYSPYNFLAWQIDILSIDKKHYLQTAAFHHRDLLSPGMAPLWDVYAPDDYLLYGLGIVADEAATRQIALYSLMHHIIPLDIINGITLSLPVNSNTIRQLNDWLRILSITHIITPMPLSENYSKSLFKDIKRIALSDSPNNYVFIYTIANPINKIRLVPKLQSKLPENALNLEEIIQNGSSHNRESLISIFDQRSYEPDFSSPANIGKTDIVLCTNNKIKVSTSCDINAHLVISNTYDPNWQASIDGHPTKIRLTNLFMQSIDIPSGRHTVELQYISPAFQLGLRISMIALVLFSLYAFVPNCRIKYSRLLRRKTRAEL